MCEDTQSLLSKIQESIYGLKESKEIHVYWLNKVHWLYEQLCVNINSIYFLHDFEKESGNGRGMWKWMKTRKGRVKIKNNFDDAYQYSFLFNTG